MSCGLLLLARLNRAGVWCPLKHQAPQQLIYGTTVEYLRDATDRIVQRKGLLRVEVTPDLSRRLSPGWPPSAWVRRWRCSAEGGLKSDAVSLASAGWMSSQLQEVARPRAWGSEGFGIRSPPSSDTTKRFPLACLAEV